jgi:hypothetical protein
MSDQSQAVGRSDDFKEAQYRPDSDGPGEKHAHPTFVDNCVRYLLAQAPRLGDQLRHRERGEFLD